VINRLLLTVSRYLVYEAGESFGKDDAAAVYLFKGDGTRWLRLDQDGLPGLASKTDLAIKVDLDDDGSFADETALDNTDDLLYYGRGADLNPDKASEPQPWRRIELTNRAPFGYFPRGYLVQVTAIMGWPAVPQGVWSATLELCGIWRTQSPRSTGNMNELDGVVGASPMAQGLVKRFKAPYLRAVVG
jgi:hypothetical protein